MARPAIRVGIGASLTGLAMAAGLLAGCAQPATTAGPGGVTPGDTTSGNPSPGGTTDGNPSPGSHFTPPPGGKTLNETEADTGHTVTLTRGDVLVVTLHSTYWSFGPAPAGAILRAQGSPSVAAVPPGAGCMPGGGCGTVTWTLIATGPGTVQVTAGRTTCGEAMGCGPGQGNFTLNVVVGQSRP